jgi:hypothetical protein
VTSNDFIDRLEQELRSAGRRRVRLELARLPRVPVGATAFAITAAICAAVAVPLLAAHSRSSGVPGGTKPAGGSAVLPRPPATPPEKVLNGNGIGQARFGERPRSVVHQVHAVLGENPTRRRFNEGRNVCGIDGEIDWPGLAAYFHHHRFVGYSYGPKITGGGVSELATARNLRVGETVKEARRLYGSAFKVSAAQGGSFSVRTPHGLIDGFLSDVTNPKGKVLTIEAGNVGCPALTPGGAARGSSAARPRGTQTRPARPGPCSRGRTCWR